MEKQRCKICGYKIENDSAYCNRCKVNTKTWTIDKRFPTSSIIFVTTGCILSIVGTIGIAYKSVIAGLFLLIFGSFLALTQVGNIRQTMRMYNLSKNDYGKFVEEMRREYPYISATPTVYKANNKSEQKQYVSHIPVCPICNSKNFVKRITTLDRSLSTAVFGIASSSIGKQWECTACRHKF